jgi:hypothetical protein
MIGKYERLLKAVPSTDQDEHSYVGTAPARGMTAPAKIAIFFIVFTPDLKSVKRECHYHGLNPSETLDEINCHCISASMPTPPRPLPRVDPEISY